MADEMMPYAVSAITTTTARQMTPTMSQQSAPNNQNSHRSGRIFHAPCRGSSGSYSTVES